jgi:quinol monooxygenase YgiN
VLIVAGTFQIDPDARGLLFEAVAPMVEATRAEPGCQAYVFSADPDDPSLVHLFELWDDQASLDAHFASDHMAAWQARAADLPFRSRDITKYLVSGTGTLP